MKAVLVDVLSVKEIIRYQVSESANQSAGLYLDKIHVDCAVYQYAAQLFSVLSWFQVQLVNFLDLLSGSV